MSAISAKKINTAGGETAIYVADAADKLRVKVRGFIILTDGTNAATLALRKGAAGAEVLTGKCGGAAFMSGISLTDGIPVNGNLYAQVTGTGAEAWILFSM